MFFPTEYRPDVVLWAYLLSLISQGNTRRWAFKTFSGLFTYVLYQLYHIRGYMSHYPEGFYSLIPPEAKTEELGVDPGSKQYNLSRHRTTTQQDHTQWNSISCWSSSAYFKMSSRKWLRYLNKTVRQIYWWLTEQSLSSLWPPSSKCKTCDRGRLDTLLNTCISYHALQQKHITWEST